GGLGRGLGWAVVCGIFWPLTLGGALFLPSSRHRACFPNTRYSGSRYFSHTSRGSTTWESPSKTAKRFCVAMDPPQTRVGSLLVIPASAMGPSQAEGPMALAK